jgi:hypothetical protein
MRSMHPSRFALPFRLILIIGFSLAVFGTEAPRTVRQIKIDSGWGGLGEPQNSDVIIRRERGEFRRDGKRVDAALVEALVAGLDAPRITKPEPENLGITPAWLKAHVTSAKRHLPGRFSDATASQKELFATAFTDPTVIAKVVTGLFAYGSLDDYPYAQVDVVFEDGSKLSANSDSNYAFLIPWELSGQNGATYNANISRAVAALMPAKTVNKERLAGNAFVGEVAHDVMLQIEPEWKLRGVEGRASAAVAALRSAYAVQRADINPYQSEEYGVPWSANGPHEANLHATLYKSSLPANLLDELVLLYENDEVEGVEGFLKAGGKYETMALSVPWLSDYILEHPKETVYVFYVHNMSFGDQAMRTFAVDMKARGREDLVEDARAQQTQITLLKIGEADWLLFPDKRMILWRYGGQSGLLKWTPSDFPPGRYGAYLSNYGGCSGREIAPDGTLVPEQGAQR